MRLLKKQNNAIYYLKDKVTSEVLYGGAAGGGKTALGCLWAIENCQKYPGIRGTFGRSKLKTLKETTLNTFFELTSKSKLNIADQYKFNEQMSVIKWRNGSEILCKDLFYYPSDPEFDSLGSLEVSFAFVDECNQIHKKAKDILKSRIRYKLNEFDLMPKMLLTCNPAKNWVYKEFYEPNKNGTILPYRKFVQALPMDNPNLPESYIETLNSLDANSKERLLHGNWEYDDDPSALCGYDNILSVLGGNSVKKDKYYLTADIARLGSDKAVIAVWHGWDVVELIEFPKSKMTELQQVINSLRIKYNIPKVNCIADEDGIGGGVVDNCEIVGFSNGATAMNGENYFNLQSQCCYKLAEIINKHDFNISAYLTGKQKDEIAEELIWLKSWKPDDEGRWRIIPKAEIKTHIGRSPDYRDTFMMRVWFDLTPTFNWMQQAMNIANSL